jgi:hypothetical protein
MTTEGQAAVRVPFGDGPAQELPINLAEAVLRELWQRSPLAFGAILRRAMVRAWPPSVNGHTPNGARHG